MSPSSPPVNAEQGRKLLQIARRALHAYFHLDEGRPEEHPIEPGGPIGGLFATLHFGIELRGCIGYLSPEADLASLAQKAVVAAAVEDPRFPRVVASDLRELRISISVLSPAEPVESPAVVVVGRDGLIVECDGARGLLLPHVARERGWDRERLLAETCRKAGLPPDAYSDPRSRVLRFESVDFSEPPA